MAPGIQRYSYQARYYKDLIPFLPESDEGPVLSLECAGFEHSMPAAQLITSNKNEVIVFKEGKKNLSTEFFVVLNVIYKEVTYFRHL